MSRRPSLEKIAMFVPLAAALLSVSLLAACSISERTEPLPGGARPPGAPSAKTMPEKDEAGGPTFAVTEFGARGDDRADDTEAIQAAVDEMTEGGTLLFPAGTYLQSGEIVVRHANVHLQGEPGATIEATAADDVAITLTADGDSISSLRLTAPNADTRLGLLAHHRVVLRSGTGQRVVDNYITGGPAVGIFMYGSHDFTVSGNTVEDTKADGIHTTAGSSGGLVAGNTVRRVGDDCIAVVSYRQDEAIVRDIVEEGNTCSDIHRGRGFSVVGGEDIVIRNNTVDLTWAAGIYLVSEWYYDTFAAHRVQVLNNRITRANTEGELGHAAIFLLGRSGSTTVGGRPVSLQNEDILIAGNTVEDTVASIANIVALDSNVRRVSIEEQVIQGNPEIPALDLRVDEPSRINLRANSFNGSPLPDQPGDQPRFAQ